MSQIREQMKFGINAYGLKILHPLTHDRRARDGIVIADNHVCRGIVARIIGVPGITHHDRCRTRMYRTDEPLCPVRAEISRHTCPRRTAPERVVICRYLQLFSMAHDEVDGPGKIFASDLRPARAVLDGKGVVTHLA